MYELVILDIDDTLLNDEGKISAATLTALRQAQERQVTIALATGRMYVSAKRIADEIGGVIPLIAYQGALVKESDGNVLYERFVPSRIAEKVIDYCRKQNYHLQLYSGDQLFVKEKNGKAEAYARMHDVTFQVEPDFKRLLEKPMTKMVIYEEPPLIDRIQSELLRDLGEDAYVTKSKPFFLEILSAEASKANAVALLCDYLGCDLSKVIGIGDGWNDIPMLEKVGLPVAMGNAVDELKRIAKFVTSSNNEDGVRKVIETYILDQKEGRP